MSDKTDAPASTTKSRLFIVLTLLIFPIIIGITTITYERCLDNRLSWCAHIRSTPVPTVAPQSLRGELVFSSDRDGDHEIYTLKDDGSTPIKLTDNPASDHDPAWSPDGSQIAFISDRDGTNELYVMAADGNGLRQLTNMDDACCPDWSPDGNKLVFNSNWPDGDHDIYIVNSDGTGLTNLTNFPGDDRNPDWSPDGTKIAFDARRDGQAEIYIMNADGLNPVRLTNLFSAQRSPAWSPTGTIIAYDSNQVEGQLDGEGDHNIYLMYSDGSNQVKIADSSIDDRYPAWSPDGQWIVFTSLNEQASELYVVEWGGQNLSRLTEGGGADWKPVP